MRWTLPLPPRPKPVLSFELAAVEANWNPGECKFIRRRCAPLGKSFASRKPSLRSRARIYGQMRGSRVYFPFRRQALPSRVPIKRVDLSRFSISLSRFLIKFKGFIIVATCIFISFVSILFDAFSLFFFLFKFSRWFVASIYHFRSLL